jgi:hypothetical protein
MTGFRFDVWRTQFTIADGLEGATNQYADRQTATIDLPGRLYPTRHPIPGRFTAT